MKKYAALSMIVISLLGLIWVGLVLAKIRFSNAFLRSDVIANQQIVREGQNASAQLHNLRLMLTNIEQMRNFNDAQTGPLAQTTELKRDKQGFAMNPAATAAAAAAVAKKALPAISMIYVSSSMQKAVISGQSYEVGDHLPNGGKIVEISLDQVVYELGKRRLTMKAPKSQILGTTVKPSLE
ncbi:hypothetical protein [Undibacterium sp. Ji22W]|uniref:hypothetical protein n=1 Tax=Undibacterium sp. Ji22W TaxID=3413038 RepID=UPI003BF19E88